MASEAPAVSALRVEDSKLQDAKGIRYILDAICEALELLQQKQFQLKGSNLWAGSVARRVAESAATARPPPTAKDTLLPPNAAVAEGKIIN